MSHFSDIGFKVESTKDLQKLSRFMRLGKTLSARKNNYSRFSDKSGAQLWFWYSDKGIECLNPHFDGETESKVLLISEEAKSECENCVVFAAWMSPADENDPESDCIP